MLKRLIEMIIDYPKNHPYEFIIIIILSLIAAGVAIVVSGIAYKKRRLVIRFTYLPIDWILPVSYSIITFLVLYVVEVLVSLILPDILPFKHIILDKVFENGLLVPIICVCMSLVFEKTVESLNLDYLDYYSEKVSKVCLSFVVSAVSIAIIVKAICMGSDDIGINEILIGRSLMWMITVIGTSLGLGFRCLGRIEKNNRRIRRINQIGNKSGEIKFWASIIICTIFCAAIPLLTLFEKVERIIMVLAIPVGIFALVGIISLVILKNIYMPNEKRSEDIFHKYIEQIKSNKSNGKHKRCGRTEYEIKGNKLIFYGNNIQYEGHENDEEFCELFKYKEENILTDNYEEILDIIKNRSKKQKDYIDKGFANCVDEKAKVKREKLELSKE